MYIDDMDGAWTIHEGGAGDMAGVYVHTLNMGPISSGFCLTSSLGVKEIFPQMPRT